MRRPGRNFRLRQITNFINWLYHPDFFAPLTTSLILAKGQGVATFARATTATLTDFEGVVRTVKAGEVRFGGARRVGNINPKSEWDSGWIAAGTTPPTINAAAVYSGKNCTSTTFAAGTYAYYTGSRAIGSFFPIKLGDRHTARFAIAADRALTSDENFVITINGANATVGVTFNTTNNVNTAWNTKASINNSIITFTGSDYYSIHAAKLNSPITIYLSERQVENTALQANQNPSEYVSNNATTGSELVVNGTFNSDLTGWLTPVTAPATVTWVSGKAFLDTATTGTARLRQSFGIQNGKMYSVLFTVSNYTGASSSLTLGNSTSGDAAYGSLGITANGTYQMTFISAGSLLGLAFYATGSLIQFSLDDVSVKELVTHGSNVDGVKYFNVLNGNTVSNNVITEATGAAIADNTLKGLLCEASKTNLNTYSSDLTNASYTKTNVTVAINATAPDGTTTANTLTTTTTSSSVYKSVTATSTKHTFSLFTKKVNLSTANFLLRNGTTATNFTTATFNYDTGIVSGTGWTVETYANGWYRLSYTNSASQIITVGDTLVIYCGFTGGTVALGSAILDWEVQLEAGGLSSSIPTVASQVVRNADVLTFPNAGNVSDTAGTVLMEVTPAFDIPNSATAGYGYNFLLDFGVGIGYIAQYANGLRRYDGTLSALTPTWIPLKGITYKIGSRYGSAGQRNWLDGTAGANEAFDGSINSSANMTIGGNGGGSGYNWGGNIKNLTIWKRALLDLVISKETS